MPQWKYALRQIAAALTIAGGGVGVLFVCAWWMFFVQIVASECPFTSPVETPGCDEVEFSASRVALIATGITGSIALGATYLLALWYLARRRGGAPVAVTIAVTVGCAAYWLVLIAL